MSLDYYLIQTSFQNGLSERVKRALAQNPLIAPPPHHLPPSYSLNLKPLNNISLETPKGLYTL
jgi:hypothetical protein